MCGFIVCISQGDPVLTHSDRIKELVSNRGPDSFQELDVQFGRYKISLSASTLHTQGITPQRQPIRGESGNLLVWNGDAFDGIPEGGECDSTLVYDLISSKSSVTAAFEEISGPYSFFYLDLQLGLAWFGRDPIGRRSLLLASDGHQLLLSSVLVRSLEAEEISTSLFCIDLNEETLSLQLFPWSHLESPTQDLNVHLQMKECVAHKILSRTMPCQEFKFDLAIFKQFHENPDIFSDITGNHHISLVLENCKNLLTQSIQKRIEKTPNYCKNCSTNCSHSKVALGFSGGLDSTILALIADKFVKNGEPIDLFNVAFKTGTGYEVPDRIGGKRSLEELKRLAPSRTWNFVEINVTRDELNEKRAERISDLIYPLNSILDDSLGSALWFVVRGAGLVAGMEYKSCARVGMMLIQLFPYYFEKTWLCGTACVSSAIQIVLLGMGADELFGGYSRHRKLFGSGNWDGLEIQLREEVLNLWKRNLGRDDRVGSDHGRQMRHPYLDEEFYFYIHKLPTFLRTYPHREVQGIGDKYMLRLLAYHLGLRAAAIARKKALQFGSRIADPKEKGHNVSERLKVI